MKYIELNGPGNVRMPIVGLGTWRAQPQETESAVENALKVGYRHIDTAFNYNNEDAIGRALKKWLETENGSREELFITTKLPHVGNRAKDVERFLNMSLQRLQLNYLDLYLIHMPFSFICNEETLTPALNEDGSFKLDLENNNVETWKAMEEQVRKGLVQKIGLSNFNAEQVREIYENAEIKPSVLQVELHAYLQQKELRKVCDELNIAVTAYSPLGSPGANNHFYNKYKYSLDNFPDILGHPIVKEVAEKNKKPEGQILLRHLTQQNVSVIPKSSNPQRIKQNIEIFDFLLSDEDLEKLNALDRGEEGRIFDFFFFKGAEKHPHYPFKQRLNQ